ncbi:STAS domain-containing protein [Micromonospora sp. NPDC047134]|uniref:STAS domain-containing protein n=1 Tax=Micromonospora sp. NPDC047134 TaxID=3154340 RepID=UPI0034011AB3
MDGLLRFDYRDMRPGIRHVTLAGEADLSTIEQLEQGLTAFLTPRWVAHLTLNLKNLRFLDCAALSALLRVRTAAMARGQQVTVIAAQGVPARVIALSGSGHLLNYHGTVRIGGTGRSFSRDLVALG